MGGPAHLADGIQSVGLAPVTFFSFLRHGHPTAENRNVDTAARFRNLQVAVENTGGTPIEKEHRVPDRPRTPGGKVHDFPFTGPVLAQTDLITTQPSFAMHETWKRHDLRVPEPVAAPKEFPRRFARSARSATDRANTCLRETVIAACRDHEANVTAGMQAAALPLGAGNRTTQGTAMSEPNRSDLRSIPALDKGGAVTRTARRPGVDPRPQAAVWPRPRRSPAQP